VIGSPIDRELLAKRDRLLERLTAMQLDLGGLFYEMAIRDAMHMDVLIGKAAELQRVHSELGQAERLLHLEHSGDAGSCPDCGAPRASGAVFCWQCGRPLLSAAALEQES
jgi:hypothetical protein